MHGPEEPTEPDERKDQRPERPEPMVRATDVVRCASGVSEATAARRVRRMVQAHAVDMPLVGRVRYCDPETAARVADLCPRPGLASAIGARFEVVADAYAACRAIHIAGETDVCEEIRALESRLTRVECLVELALNARAAAHGKKTGYMRA
jgi:hypothetical protein